MFQLLIWPAIAGKKWSCLSEQWSHLQGPVLWPSLWDEIAGDVTVHIHSYTWFVFAKWSRSDDSWIKDRQTDMSWFIRDTPASADTIMTGWALTRCLTRCETTSSPSVLSLLTDLSSILPLFKKNSIQLWDFGVFLGCGRKRSCLVKVNALINLVII